MTGGNKAIRDHTEDGRKLHLFECVGWFEEQPPGTDRNHRKALRFKLEPVTNDIEFTASDLDAVDTGELYERAKGAATTDRGSCPTNKRRSDANQIHQIRNR